ncbi:hypothetical protein [Haliscomenobacter hydrossis]|uniref:DUF4351 domain-containing protein n=1 Tax=Haliscomenobacter hydrossis (strain ATCC 27775 / DSM 1100 / LMG 10767 / O) TaxID=760192 RepID=F4KZZ9_HALH1|nr:hypothetical protein [Haliscomenobacter hydrossis]AEE51569.1 hypothetical protein Halhy_3717 [Haliscomenobacter hydrossis DSM 1100]
MLLGEYRLEVFTERNFYRLLAEEYLEEFRSIIEESKEKAFSSVVFKKLSKLTGNDIEALAQRLVTMSEEEIILFIDQQIATL